MKHDRIWLIDNVTLKKKTENVENKIFIFQHT